MVVRFPKDTTDDAIRIQHQALRRLGLAGRAAMTFELGNNLRNIVESGIRLHHPEFSEFQTRAAIARRLLGRELAKRVGAKLGQGTGMSQEDFFEKIISALGNAGIPFMVVGSLASSLHGDPRSTRDADIVIRPDSRTLDDFLQQIGSQFYVAPETARRALLTHSMFNVIDAGSGWKVDLIIAPATDFGEESFLRRLSAKVLGVDVAVQTAEDTILSKLAWGKDSGSEMQYRDALSVALEQWEKLDKEYLRRWAPELGVSELLQKILEEASRLA
jgi:hypothetical protein